MMKVGSLFSGIGGFELGFLGAATVLVQNDNDAAAKSVLLAQFPDVPVVPDVADVSLSDVQGCDLIVGGFPCQDVSIVGGQKGLNGTRTPLVRHVFRLVGQLKPDRFLLENVQSIRFVHGGRVLAHLVHEAERLKYAWAYRTLDSRAFDLPQRRRRFYFLASRVDDPGAALLSDIGGHVPETRVSLDRPIGFYWTEGRSGHGMTGDAVPPLKSGSAIGIPSPPAVLLPDGSVVLPTIETAERLQGFPSGWTQHAPARLRWRLVGNAVSPPVVQWIAAQILNPNPWNSTPKSHLRAGEKWPLAAWGDGQGNRFQVEVGEAPSASKFGRLSDHHYEWSQISSRALSGFVARARESKLRYPPGFLDRLEQAL